MSSFGDIGVLTTDAELIVQSWDEWLAGVTSIPSEDAKGRSLAELIPDLAQRGLLERFRQSVASGIVQVFTSTLNGPLLPCRPRHSSTHFEQMQQRVTVGPLLDGDRIAGLVVTVQDVTTQLDAERDLAAALMSGDAERQRAAADAIATAPRVESLDSFSPALRSDNWRVRRAAVEALAAAADEDLLRAVLATLQREHRDFSTLSSALRLLAITEVDLTGPLTELLRGADVDLRIQAALALGEQQHPAAIPALLPALDDPDANVRFHAIEALGRLRAATAVDKLLPIAQSRDFFLSFAAIEALAAIGDRRVAPRLVPLLENDAIREAVARTIGQLGDERVLVALVITLDKSRASAEAAVTALCLIAERLSGDGLDVSPLIRASLTEDGRRHMREAARALPPEAGCAVVRLLRWVGGSESCADLGALLADARCRKEAAEALADMGEPAVDVLIAKLDDEDDEVRTVAIAALGLAGSPRATPALCALLDDPEAAIPASGALARIADQDAFEPLCRLIGHRDPAVRMAAVGALNAIGHPRMQDVVIALLEHEDAPIRESAMRIAGYFGYRSATGLALARARDSEETVRVAALEHLPFFDEERALPVLGEALASDSPKARAAAVRALGRIESDSARPFLVRALGDPDSWVRYFAARGLGEQPAGDDIPELARLAESDVSAPVRVAALEAMGRRGAATSLAVLLRCAVDANTDIAAAALLALGRLGGPDAIAALRAGARSQDVAWRKAATEGLGATMAREAVSDLEWIAAADEDPGVVECAIRKLADVASAQGDAAPAAVDSLVALLADSGRYDRAIGAISRLPAALTPRVARGLAHAQPIVRQRTVEALIRCRRPEATDLLAPAFIDDDAAVREAAATAVLRLGTHHFDDTLRQLAADDPEGTVRRAAAEALAVVSTTH